MLVDSGRATRAPQAHRTACLSACTHTHTPGACRPSLGPPPPSCKHLGARPLFARPSLSSLARMHSPGCPQAVRCGQHRQHLPRPRQFPGLHRVLQPRVDRREGLGEIVWPPGPQHQRHRAGIKIGRPSTQVGAGLLTVSAGGVSTDGFSFGFSGYAAVNGGAFDPSQAPSSDTSNQVPTSRTSTPQPISGLARSPLPLPALPVVFGWMLPASG